MVAEKRWLCFSELKYNSVTVATCTLLLARILFVTSYLQELYECEWQLLKRCQFAVTIYTIARVVLYIPSTMWVTIWVPRV